MGKSLSVSNDSLPVSNYSLHLAAMRGEEEAVVLLLKQRCNPEAVDMMGWTALHYACLKGFFSIAKLLLDNRASLYSAVLSTGETALHIAASRGYEDIIALLLRNGADVHAVDKQGYTALLHAVYAPYENALKQLLSHGADISVVSADGRTALSLACFHGRSHVANLLIECGADVHWVGTDQSSRGYTLIHYAARNGMIKTIQLLLDMKVDVDAEAESGRTALHEACHWRTLNAVECLLQNGAQVSYPCRNGFTGLHFAAQGYRSGDAESVQVVELLFKYGADVNAEDEKGRTPLDLAASLESGTEMFKVFAKQLMKMKTQELFVSENNLKELSENKEAKCFSASCEEEIERMKKSAISDSSITIYDIFTKGENRLADFVSNENVERVLESENYKADFPIYAGAISEKFLQGRERRDLLRQSCTLLWAVISEFYELPYVCVQRINRNLMNTDLALQISQEPSQQDDSAQL